MAETLALCMPVYDKVSWQAWQADMDLGIHLGQLLGEDNVVVLTIHKLPQPHAQNYMLNSVLKMKLHDGKRPDWVLWVEDDSVPPKNAFELLRSQASPDARPVMHGVSFDRMPPHHPSIWRWKKDEKGKIEPIHDWEPNTLYQLAHSGTCCALIHTTVFDRLKRPWFRMQPFEPGVQGMIPCISLSQRMHEAHVPIFGYTGCVVRHLSEAVPIGPEISATARQRELAQNQ